MNEELEQSARSSGLGQGKDKQDDCPNFEAADELDDFLIRRQLLAMESKRIQTVLADTAAEVKSKQGDLVNLRDRVLTSLRERLHRQEEAARVESARQEEVTRAESLDRQKLENLPKIGGALHSPSGQATFRLPETRLGAVMDSSDAAPAMGPGWHLPKVQQLWPGRSGLPSTIVPRVSRRAFEKIGSRLLSLSAGGLATF